MIKETGFRCLLMVGIPNKSFEENREKPLEFVQFVVNLLFFEWGPGVLLSVVH